MKALAPNLLVLSSWLSLSNPAPTTTSPDHHKDDIFKRGDDISTMFTRITSIIFLTSNAYFKKVSLNIIIRFWDWGQSTLSFVNDLHFLERQKLGKLYLITYEGRQNKRKCKVIVYVGH